MIWLTIGYWLAFWLYSIHLKDIYYGYGRAVALIYGQKAEAIWEEDWLKFEFPDGNEEVYMGNLGNSVAKLLIKNGVPVTKL